MNLINFSFGVFFICYDVEVKFVVIYFSNKKKELISNLEREKQIKYV